MRFRQLLTIRAAVSVVAGIALLSCSDGPIGPRSRPISPVAASYDVVPPPLIVISQVYGGGGNAGATYKNDFIELFNPGTSPANVTGWSVQYASTTGATWQVTNLTGTIQPGAYYLIQESAGAGGTTSLPTPDATGGIAMAAGAGKVFLSNTTTALTLACPTSAAVVNKVSYGTGTSDCGFGTTATLANATAAIRNSGGCAYSETPTSMSTDFTVAAPTPRNSASPTHPCGAATVTVTPSTASINSGATQAFTAAEADASSNPISTTFTWSSSNTAIATVDANGVATAATTAGTATIKATATDGVFGTALLTVTVAQPATVTVTPATASITTGATQAFSAAAVDASNNPVSTTFTWSSSDNTIATVDANGLATAGGTSGTATIKATAANAVFGTAALTVTTLVSHSGEIVISQIYGGGGNNGATLKNDFIEIFNRSTQAVSLIGWSVQQTSAGGGSWNVTPLSGSIPSGGYYLIQESQGAGGAVDLPAPDATGTIAMGAASGKVLLAQTTTAFAVACPTGSVIVDLASYGAGTNCGASAPAPANATADIRQHGGCTWTTNPANDFTVSAPTPRNSASPTRSCVAGPLDHLVITGTLSALVGGTTQLTASALDANDNTVNGATITWATSDATVATVGGTTGLVTGVSSSGSPATITATAVAGGVTKTASVDVAVTNPGGINWIDVSSSTQSFPPGFQTQLFATARESQGGTIIPATFTFEAVDVQYIAAQTIQNTGIITGVAAPADASHPGIRITATPTGGGTPFSFVTHTITIEQPNTAPTSIYAVNDDFGDPTAAGSSNPNDFLIRRTQYVLSYNQSHGTPNWVSYELDARQMVAGQDRCNCFSADPLLPSAAQILTSDYTNGGFDRGHMTRSADRTAANVDNAITFFTTNVVPQQGDLNQGVWAQFENMLADSARAGRAVYIVTGPLYSRSHPSLTFLKNEGKVAIPDSTWKVALIGPGNSGNPFTHANVQNWSDLAGLTILAVNMPNISGVRNDPPSKYFTTVEAIEEATGYDLLSVLTAAFTTAIEYHDHGPTAQVAVTGTPNEGSPLTFDGSASTDPDIGRTDLGRTEALTYSWHFSDGTDATGAVVTKTFANHGSYTATLTVTDAFGWPGTSTTTLAIANLPPSATFTAPSSVPEGTGFTIALTGGTDPSPADAAALTYAFDCGAGYSSPSSSSTAACAPPDPGEHTVRGKVIDPGGAFAEYTATVTIIGDTQAPTVLCGTADGAWHATDVTIGCTASDAGSGLLNAGDASFTLTTHVASGTETAGASTDSRTVCDRAHNCVTVGPIGGNMIDKRPPTISISAPTNQTYSLNQNLPAAFTCGDGGSGISTCTGTVANGALVATATLGSHAFSVSAMDAIGNSATTQVTYTVAYNQCVLFDQTKSYKAGSTIPIKLQLCDAAGANVSDASIPVVATGVYLVSTSAPGPLGDSGNANPDNQFRFAGGSYIYNLSLKGFTQGTYAMTFTAGSDPTTHTVQFQVK